MIVVTFVFGLLNLQAQEVISVSWPTKNASPPVIMAKPASDFLPIFRFALSTFPESNIVSMVMSQPYFIGLSQQDAVRLQGLFDERYQKIQEDPVFCTATSMLPYCYAEGTPTYGLALAYRPKNIDTNTHCLIFLHGYGGSFLWSQQLLAESFPNCIIICPAWGISSSFMPAPIFRNA